MLKKHSIRLKRAEVQIVVVGLVAMLSVGIFNAMNGLGSAGGDDSKRKAAAYINVIKDVIFGICGPLGSFNSTLFGLNRATALGATGYLSLTFCVFLVFVVDLPALFLYVGSAICGIFASSLWASIGTAAMTYSTPEKTNKAFAVIFGLFNLGGFLGSILTVSINGSARRSVVPWTYVLLTGLNITAVLISILFLKHPKSIVRRDGTSVMQLLIQSPAHSQNESVLSNQMHVIGSELQRCAMVYKDWRVFAIMPVSFLCLCHTPILFSGLNGRYFVVSVRGTNSSMYWLSRIAGSVALDRMTRGLGPGSDLRHIFGVCVGIISLANILLICAMFNVLGIFRDSTLYGWHDTPQVMLAISCILVFGLVDSVFQGFMYQIIRLVASADDYPLWAGAFKANQAFGSAIAWLATLLVSWRRQALALVISWAASLPFVWLVCINAIDNSNNETSNVRGSSPVTATGKDSAEGPNRIALLVGNTENHNG